MCLEGSRALRREGWSTFSSTRQHKLSKEKYHTVSQIATLKNTPVRQYQGDDIPARQRQDVYTENLPNTTRIGTFCPFILADLSRKDKVQNVKLQKMPGRFARWVTLLSRLRRKAGHHQKAKEPRQRHRQCLQAPQRYLDRHPGPWL